jgi:hypothetical protein
VHGVGLFDKENILFGSLQVLLCRLWDCAFERSKEGLDVGQEIFGLLEALGEGGVPIFVYYGELCSMAGHAAHV